jgi:uncharacterized membrane protein
MTDKQLYTLCGTICLVGTLIANSQFLGIMALFWFVSALAEMRNP